MWEDLNERYGKESVCLLVLSSLLIVASFAVPWILGSRLMWTEAMAVKYQQAAANYHDALHQHSDHGHGNETAPNLATAQSEYQQLQRRLDYVQSGGSGIGSILGLIGGLMSAVGIGLAVWRRRARSS